jgi:quercetin dioxygenase-like cupin family protein
VKLKDEFVWHKHDESDFFLVLSGHVTIQLRDGHVEPDEGELFVVPRGSSTARAPTRRPPCC